ncbi:hypothetical protein [Methylobacterium aerolatum]|uniref:Uncharacterized protein n=1 Tax=Methylobacterium aerolatum TaxID=418708 RepID=A0ABU0I0L6_9HYPH|nr:hypothetical protein [Methylobacterium aerolatum]MDQ0448131.1 hypothetical protein [Methylobacterium aerolatum]GJD34001.1 hypothetical protein FMGBMHLM_0897 [Methylobacterium aerolatum]
MAKRHLKTTPENVEAVLSAYRLAVAGQPFHEELAKVRSLGSIVEVKHTPDNAMAVQVRTLKGELRSPRKMDCYGALILGVLSLPGGSPYFNPDRRKGFKGELHYLYVCGQPIVRVLADAQAGEKVEYGADHRDLRPSTLRVVPVSRGRSSATRPEATAEALRNYDANAAKWGLAGILSRDDYAATIEGSYRLFDQRHAAYLKPATREAAE